MKWFNNLKIGQRILSGFLLVVIIAGIIGGIGIFALRRVNDSYSVAYTDSTDALKYSEKMSSSFQRIRMNLYGVALAESYQDKTYYLGRIDNFKIVIDENIAEYRQMLAHYNQEEVELEINLIDAVQESLVVFGAKREEFIQEVGMNANLRNEAFAWLQDGGELRDLAVDVDGAITNLIDYNIGYAAEQIANNARLASVSTIMIIVGVVIGIIIAVIIALFISQNISRKLILLVEASDKLALGDVNVNVNADTKDELGHLARSFGAMIENIRSQAQAAEKMANGDFTIEVEVRSEKDLLGRNLHEIVEKNNEVLGNIAIAAEQVASGAGQVSDSSMALSQGATEQASSIEELTASVEEISSQTKQNAQNANRANELAETAKTNAVQGNMQMQEMLKAMEEINESSSNISKIIKVIDDIAFQTNMLALNAAVEAARAGQHGKGFAVVAEEVKNLAARSANAAKETTEMIESSIQKTEGGTTIAKETAKALQDIVDKIEEVATLVNGISVASDEQDSGVSQINQGIMQVSQVVQSNSATSEESAAASEELSSQAELLQDMVRKFKLKDNARSHAKAGELSPEVIRMPDEMTKKDGFDLNESWEVEGRTEAAKVKTALSDIEFGKY